MPNIKIKLKVAGVWQQLFPETIVDQITDASTFGKKVLKVANPGAISFMKVADNGDITWRTPAQMLADLGAAAASHPHTVDDITNLNTTLAAKADLSGGVIVSSQIPSFVTGGLKYKGAFAANQTLNATFVTNETLTTDGFTNGRYWIVTAAAGITISYGAGFAVESPGDEGEFATGFTLERGDWLVYKGYSASTYLFNVINNTYRKADTANYGIVRISNNANAYRGGLSSTVDDSKIIDEKMLRQVMKDIYYKDTEALASTALDGDLLFEF
jgi:hypothetical protein